MLFRGRSGGTGVFLGGLLTTLVAFFPRLVFCCAGCLRFFSRRQRLRVQRALVTPGLRHDEAGAQEQCDHQCRNLLHSILRSNFFRILLRVPPGKPASACRDLLRLLTRAARDSFLRRRANAPTSLKKRPHRPPGSHFFSNKKSGRTRPL